MLKLPHYIQVKENTVQGKLAALLLKSHGAAIVFGKTIYLYNISKTEFLSNPRLVRHELKHVEQYAQFGFLGFLMRYGWYSLRFGYYNNPLEKEARAAETVLLDMEKTAPNPRV